MTVTSPPYNIGKEYEKCLSLDDYLDWSKKWIKQVYNITHNHGTCWLNLGYLSIPYLIWEKIPFYLMQEVVKTFLILLKNNHHEYKQYLFQFDFVPFSKDQDFVSRQNIQSKQELKQ